MANLGPNQLVQYSLPAGWDAARLNALALESGYTYDDLIGDLTAALSLANGALLDNPLIAGLVSITDTPEVEYRVGVSNGFEVHTEGAPPNAKRGATTGHMLPLVPYDRALGWSWDFLRKARRTQIEADLNSAMSDMANLWEKSILTRLFKSTYDSVGTGKSVPFADGGTADSSYVPVAVPARGGTFASSHSHFSRLDGIAQANLEIAVANLWEHGIDGPYDLLIADADVSSWANVTNVTGWKNRAYGEITYGNSVSLANVADTSYIGVVETAKGACRVRSSGRVPTKYWTLYKSAGANNMQNPLKVYGSPQYGANAILLSGDHVRQYPLENAILFMEFGVGVGENRVAAVSVYNHTSGSYVTPTIS